MRLIISIFILLLTQLSFAQSKNRFDREKCKQGYWEFHERGKLMKGEFLNDSKIGLWEKIDKKGRLVYQEYYDTNGNHFLDSVVIYRKGERYTGKYTQLEPDEENYGQFLESKGEVIDGLKEGKWVTYYRGNRVKEVATYKRGVKVGEYQKFDHYKNLVKQGDYKDNRKEGEWEHYRNFHYEHKEAVLQRVFTYKEGSLHGRFASFYSDQQPQVMGTYFENKKHGQWINNRRTSKRINNYNMGKLDGNQDWYQGDSLISRFVVHDDKLKEIIYKSHDEGFKTDSFENGNGLVRFKEMSLNAFFFNAGVLSKHESIKLFKDDIYSGAVEFIDGDVKDGRYLLHRYFAGDHVELIVKDGQFLIYDDSDYFQDRHLAKFSETIQLIYQRKSKAYTKIKSYEYHTISQVSTEDSMVIISQTKDSSYNVRAQKKFYHGREVRYYIYPKHMVRQGLDMDSSYYNEYFSLKGIKSFKIKKKDYPIYRFVNKTKNVEGTEDVYWNPELGIINNYFTSWGDYVTLKRSSINNEETITAINKMLVKDQKFFGWLNSQRRRY